MKRKMAWPVIAFVSVFLLHASYTIWNASNLASSWISTGSTNWIYFYFQTQEYLLGMSYALAAAFTVYALIRYIETKRCGVGGVLGGLTFTGVMYFAACFLLGCCGSPMLAVYLSLFGSSVLGLTKSLTFALTAVSVFIGYLWTEKKFKAGNCCGKGKGGSYANRA